MFLETSSPQTNGMLARLLTPTYPAPANGHCVEFYFNMYGDNIDTLSIIHKQQVPIINLALLLQKAPVVPAS